jgi:type VI secretion system protein ImpK
MSERRKDDADPDATVMLPAGRAKAPAADDDATVMIPVAKADDDATVMVPFPKEDDDATVMVPAARADDDATVMMPISERETRATGEPVAARSPEPDPEATIAIPTPGRKRDAAAPSLPASPATGAEPTRVDPDAMGGLNPLVAAANPVLAVVAQIRHALRHPDPEGLRTRLRNGIAGFEASARAAGVGEDTVASASRALAALAYESAASTPWGADWDAGDGEAVFQQIERLSVEAPANKELLEFLYVCLSLGYEGRYRKAADGRQALVAVRGSLLEQLRAMRPAGDGELSGRWKGVLAPARRPAGALGLWVAACGVALLLAALYIGFSLSLGSQSDPVARELAQLKAPVAPDKPRAVAAAVQTPRIAEQLAAEVGRGEITVTDAAGTSTIVIRSDRLFASGSTRLEPAIEPVVLRVAEALDRVPGTILVTGHTDDVPIRTARFPSNWELSTERAASVVKLMAGKLKDSGRLSVEGLADSAPAAPNDSSANRARNRRVEIILRSAS